MPRRGQKQEDLFTDVAFEGDPVSPSATVHDLLAAKGRRGAAAYASRTQSTQGRRAPMDILAGPRGGRIIAVAADAAEAAAVLDQATSELAAGHVYSGWCMLGLPYRRPKGDENLWRISTDYADITVEAGSRKMDNGDTVWSGVPYGAYARMVLIALQSEALDRNSPFVDLGNTAYDVLRRLGLPDGGKVADATLEQLEKIVRCKVSFRIGSDAKGLEINERLVEAFEYDNGGGRRFIRRLKLSKAFFESLKRHPVPIDRDAAVRIRNSPMALDIYLWLAYRLPAIEGNTRISWTALWRQFGSGIATMRFFKRPFAENLELARSIYPTARFELTEAGIILFPSPPPRRVKALPAA